MKVTLIPVVVGARGIIPKGSVGGKKTGGIENKEECEYSY